MKCDKARRLLSAMAGDGLGRWSRMRLERHLAHCEQCRATCRNVQAMNEALKSVATPLCKAPPEEPYWAGFWGRLRPRLASGEAAADVQETPARHGALVMALAVAAAVLACVAVWAHSRAAALRGDLEAARARIARLEASAEGPARGVRLVTDGGVSPKDVALFHEMDLTFASDLKWVATDDRKIDLGITHTISPPAAPSVATDADGVAAVQMAVFEEAHGEARLLNRARILARDGCKAEFSTEGEGLTFHYECTPLIASGGQAVLKLGVAAFAANGEGRALAGASVRMRSGQEVELARIRAEEGTYSVRVALGLWWPQTEAH